MDGLISEGEDHRAADQKSRRGVRARIAGTLRRRRMAVLLATLVLLVLASPLADQSLGSRLVIVIVAITFFIASVQQGGRHPQTRRFIVAVASMWLFFNVLAAMPGFAWTKSLGLVALSLLVLANLSLIARGTLSAKVVNSELLCSAFGGYLAIGIFWAATYGIVALIAPGAFAVSAGGGLNQGALMYFSFTTLTTTGYGDIVAVDPFLRMWVVLEAIVGTMYAATVIARLVSLYGRELNKKGEA